MRTLYNSRWLWPAIIVASAASAGALVATQAHTPLRPLATIWFLFLCPGMALVRLINLRDWVAELMLGIALSVTLTGLVSGTMLYFDAWSPPLSLAILIGISLAGALAQLIVGRRPPPTYDQPAEADHEAEPAPTNP